MSDLPILAMAVITQHRQAGAGAGAFTAEEDELVDLLLSLDQAHLFADWEPPGINEESKRAFFAQIRRLNESYHGGLACYCENAKDLLVKSKNGLNPLEGWYPTVPEGVSIDPDSEDFLSYEMEGLRELGRCGFVLVAGGLGERLGYSGVKIELPIETVTHTSYISMYCQSISAIQSRYGSVEVREIPLAIMVSDDTELKTIELLKSNSYFGLNPSQVKILKQDKVPALLDNDAHIAKIGKYEIDSKPHGHGDVHSLMHLSGTAESWAHRGVKWIFFFQDTNGLAFLSLPSQLGVSIKLGLEVNSMAAPRKAKQALGGIAKLVHVDGRTMTINVEYNQLDPLLRSTTSPDGDVNSEVTGVSPYPGNINQLIFSIAPYLDNLKRMKGGIAEFVNPKYADASKTVFKKPTRLECMMQDYPKTLGSGAKVGFTMAPLWLCYSPCKNNIVDAATSLRNGIPSMGAYSAESDQYFVWAELLRKMGAKVQSAAPLTICGIEAIPSPRLVFSPSFTLFPSELLSRFPDPSKVLMSADSTLCISGDCVVRSINLDGSLLLENQSESSSSFEIDFDASASIVNKGHKLTSIDELHKSNGSDNKVKFSEVDLMRGYVLEGVETEKVAVTADSSSFADRSHSCYLYNGLELKQVFKKSKKSSDI